MSAACQLVERRLRVRGIDLEIAALRRGGVAAPVVFLHGFGSTKEDYADVVRQAVFDPHGVLAYDAPGCGDTRCGDNRRVDVSFLVETAGALLALEGIERFHLVGHSMGGITALLLADSMPDHVLSFCSIEGNLGPEDCFLSRQIHEFPSDHPQAFLEAFVDRMRRDASWSSALYASSLPVKVRADAVRGIFSSMVELSDTAGLLARFLKLPCPKMFMHGDQNAALSYLPRLADHGVELAEIPHCGHFPMYANPPEMWRRLGQFIASSNAA